MARRNADQLDLLSYRPPVEPDVVLPKPVVSQESKEERSVTWTAPEGTVMVAEDDAELDRVVAEVEAALEDAGIVSFLRHGRQRRALRAALTYVFLDPIYDRGDPHRLLEVTELVITGSRYFIRRKPADEEYGSRTIQVSAKMQARRYLRYSYQIFLGIRGGATAYRWKTGATKPEKVTGWRAYDAARSFY